jgi:Ca-activated chloride channel family protein
MVMEITFVNPLYLWFLVAIPLMVLAHFISLRFVRKKALKFANFPAIEYVTGQRILSNNYTLLVVRLITLLFLILGVSGAVLWYEAQAGDSSFALAIDSSGSMMATDFMPSRIDAAKTSAMLFADSVPEQTEISVLSFAGVGFIKQVPTTDFARVRTVISNISIELAGGTAIGTAIISSVNMLSGSQKSKIIVLLTDGQNNVGPSVEEAIAYANDNHVTVYTIGIGTESGGRFPEMNLSFVSVIDSETLSKIASDTQGRYYEAKNESALAAAYKEIATSNVKKIPLNISLIFLATGVILLFVEWGLLNTKYRTLP